MLCLQAAILFFALDRLDPWTDEQFTADTVAHPVSEIIPIVKSDMHPPLYFVLLRLWPWSTMPGLRAFSAMWAVFATLLLDLFWTRRWKPLERWIALTAFALSPCLLLYGRMARSYSMQIALAIVCVALLERWTRRPGSIAIAVAAAAASLALLYTHYAPGLAILVGFALIAWRAIGLLRMALFAAAVAIGYVPWMLTLLDAVRRLGGHSRFSAGYLFSGNVVTEQFIKVGFGVVSMTIGESFFLLSVLLVPVLVVLTAIGIRSLPRRAVWTLAIATLLCYAVSSIWVSYPFIPGRMIWLLPFVTLALALGIARIHRPPVRWAIVAAIAVSFASSNVLYFRRENFLNLGYAAPLRDMASMLNRDVKPGDLILMDYYNVDYPVLSKLLRAPSIALDDAGVTQARASMASAPRIWIVHTTRDVSPNSITTAIQKEACSGRSRRDTLFEPLAGWQQSLTHLTHHYAITLCGPAP